MLLIEDGKLVPGIRLFTMCGSFDEAGEPVVHDVRHFSTDYELGYELPSAPLNRPRHRRGRGRKLARRRR